MVIIDPLSQWEIKRAFGFRYPPSFIQLQSEFAALSCSNEFKSHFSSARFISTSADILLVHKKIPGHLIPFLACPNPRVTDHYSFNVDSPGPEYQVQIFADHAVVAEWHDFTAFLKWISNECLNK